MRLASTSDRYGKSEDAAGSVGRMTGTAFDITASPFVEPASRLEPLVGASVTIDERRQPAASLCSGAMRQSSYRRCKCRPQPAQSLALPRRTGIRNRPAGVPLSPAESIAASANPIRAEDAG